MRGQLISVWKALDEDGSGYLEAGEFGKFMRASQARAAGPAGHATRARGQPDRTADYHPSLAAQERVTPGGDLVRDDKEAQGWKILGNDPGGEQGWKAQRTRRNQQTKRAMEREARHAPLITSSHNLLWLPPLGPAHPTSATVPLPVHHPADYLPFRLADGRVGWARPDGEACPRRARHRAAGRDARL